MVRGRYFVRRPFRVDESGDRKERTETMQDRVDGMDYAVIKNQVLERSGQMMRHLEAAQSEFDAARVLFRKAAALRLVEMFVEAGWELGYYSAEDPHTVYIEPKDPVEDPFREPVRPLGVGVEVCGRPEDVLTDTENRVLVRISGYPEGDDGGEPSAVICRGIPTPEEAARLLKEYGVELDWAAGFTTTVNTVELRSLNDRS